MAICMNCGAMTASDTEHYGEVLDGAAEGWTCLPPPYEEGAVGMFAEDNLNYDDETLRRQREIAGIEGEMVLREHQPPWKYLAINICDPETYTDLQLESMYQETEAESMWLAERADKLKAELKRRSEGTSLNISKKPVVEDPEKPWPDVR